MKKKSQLEANYLTRRRKLLKCIKGDAALFIAPAPQRASRDREHPYATNSDLLYLTGIDESDCALVLLGTNRGPRSIIYLRDKDAHEARWAGDRIGLKAARRRFKVDEVRSIESLSQDIPKLVDGCQTLHYTLGSHPKIDQIVTSLLQSHVGPRLNLPHTLKDARILTSEMRWVKDRDEIRCLRHAAEITAEAFLEFIPYLREPVSEIHAARLLEAAFAHRGSDSPAFATIVASGKNATCLHHTPQYQPLWRNELVLIDAGATYRGYAGDITRTFSVAGKFPPAHAAIYDIVQNALSAGIKKAKPDSTLNEIHGTIIHELTQGLIDERIIRGSVANAVEEQKYKAFYMHRSSHWLGLDVHDIAPVLSKKTGLFENSYDRALVAGNVFTVEPGLYFDANDEKVPKKFRGIGVRIEDDILITDSGCDVLTASLPTNRSEVETLFV